MSNSIENQQPTPTQTASEQLYTRFDMALIQARENTSVQFLEGLDLVSELGSIMRPDAIEALEEKRSSTLETLRDQIAVIAAGLEAAKQLKSTIADIEQQRSYLDRVLQGAEAIKAMSQVACETVSAADSQPVTTPETAATPEESDEDDIDWDGGVTALKELVS